MRYPAGLLYSQAKKYLIKCHAYSELTSRVNGWQSSSPHFGFLHTIYMFQLIPKGPLYNLAFDMYIHSIVGQIGKPRLGRQGNSLGGEICSLGIPLSILRCCTLFLFFFLSFLLIISSKHTYNMYTIGLPPSGGLLAVYPLKHDTRLVPGSYNNRPALLLTGWSRRLIARFCDLSLLQEEDMGGWRNISLLYLLMGCLFVLPWALTEGRKKDKKTRMR